MGMDLNFSSSFPQGSQTGERLTDQDATNEVPVDRSLQDEKIKTIHPKISLLPKAPSTRKGIQKPTSKARCVPVIRPAVIPPHLAFFLSQIKAGNVTEWNQNCKTFINTFSANPAPVNVPYTQTEEFGELSPQSSSSIAVSRDSTPPTDMPLQALYRRVSSIPHSQAPQTSMPPQAFYRRVSRIPHSQASQTSMPPPQMYSNGAVYYDSMPPRDTPPQAFYRQVSRIPHSQAPQTSMAPPQMYSSGAVYNDSMPSRDMPPQECFYDAVRYDPRP